MIDLHSHILPGIDDGAANLDVSIQMARASVENGVSILACTPHILPGVWNNSGPAIRAGVETLQRALDEREIPLRLVTGADVHIAPDLLAGIRSGRVLSLHDTRYILLELPHHVMPPHADACFFELLAAGYIPVFTHPERLSWVHGNYDFIERMVASGVWMQITAGSLVGAFGSRARYLSEKMLDDGFVHILASDTHDVDRRPPLLAEGWEKARSFVGDEEAHNLVVTRPYGILNDELPNRLPAIPSEKARSMGLTDRSRRAPGGKGNRDRGEPVGGFSGWVRRFLG